MTKERIGIIKLNDKEVPIFRLDGDGQCSCRICEIRKGWNRIWTCMCYMINETVICNTCYSRIKKELKIYD